MKTAFQIFRRDVRRLLKNRAATLVMIGVCLLPSLYAWFNIAANMDPYANTSGIRVAIANCDTGTKTDVITMNAGDSIVEKLKENKSLGWQFVSEEKAKELGVTPMATWIGGELAGVEPRIMGIGPVAATRKVMEKTGYQIGDFDLIEANEAFAAQSVAVGQDLGFDMDKLNVNGGAIALGHPVGCSGTRILVTLLYEMQKRNAQKGLATLCVGGGMGAAAIVEKY